MLSRSISSISPLIMASLRKQQILQYHQEGLCAVGGTAAYLTAEGEGEQHKSSSSAVALQQLSVLGKERLCENVEWHHVVMGTPLKNDSRIHITTHWIKVTEHGSLARVC